ncbi:MAG: hypothetical protein LDL37_04150 [Asticcacaulis sp.]|uniref:hypothetical protein n=1 Tax=Asticcacaulis sp. TaxID=1872648 RepID=UPI0025BEE682|nr:hypothetical protein [Asticcacaulis sp.]MCA1934620.1 hypothetical protein [Asticcacaulis sp.]
MQIADLYVELMDEGTTVYRPAKAYRLNEHLLVLSNEYHDPTTENWSVLPGTLITLRQKRTTDGMIAVAQRYEFAQ